MTLKQFLSQTGPVDITKGFSILVLQDKNDDGKETIYQLEGDALDTFFGNRDVIGKQEKLPVGHGLSGWLRMDGSTYNIADYPTLAAVLGSDYEIDNAPDAAVQFKVPNQRLNPTSALSYTDQGDVTQLSLASYVITDTFVSVTLAGLPVSLIYGETYQLSGLTAHAVLNGQTYTAASENALNIPTQILFDNLSEANKTALPTITETGTFTLTILDTDLQSTHATASQVEIPAELNKLIFTGTNFTVGEQYYINEQTDPALTGVNDVQLTALTATELSVTAGLLTVATTIIAAIPVYQDLSSASLTNISYLPQYPFPQNLELTITGVNLVVDRNYRFTDLPESLSPLENAVMRATAANKLALNITQIIEIYEDDITSINSTGVYEIESIESSNTNTVDGYDNFIKAL